MTHMTNKPIPKLRKAPQPPLSHPGAIPDSERAKKPALSEPYVTDQELNPGDRVEGLGDFGKPTGELGTVEQTNEEDALVKWDDDGRVRRHQPSLKKVKLAGQAKDRPGKITEKFVETLVFTHRLPVLRLHAISVICRNDQF
jgi:hypothetical protein